MDNKNEPTHHAVIEVKDGARLGGSVDEIIHPDQLCETSSAPDYKALYEAEVAAKNVAYSERNHVIAALARAFPSGTRPTEIDGWDPEWNGCVYIDLPTGQVSYHYHSSEAHLFSDLPAYTKSWDGHDKATVHARLKSLGFGPDQRYLMEFIKLHRDIGLTCDELNSQEIANIGMWCEKLDNFIQAVATAQSRGEHPSRYWK